MTSMTSKTIITTIALGITLAAGLTATPCMARGNGPANGPAQVTGNPQPQAGLLLPAVQAAREAARRSTSPRRPVKRVSPAPARGQDGNDLLIVNNGDGSDF